MSGIFSHVPDEILIGAGAGIGLLVLILIVVIVMVAKSKSRGGAAAGGGGTMSSGGTAVKGGKVVEQWTLYARENQLTLTGEFPLLQLEGGARGINVRFWQSYKDADGDPVDDEEGAASAPPAIVSEAAVTIPAPVGDLNIAREGFFAKSGVNFGGQDIKLNDTQFDTAFIVKHSHPEHIFHLLTPPIRDALLAAQRSFPDVVVSEGMVRLRGNGATDIQTVDRILKALITAAAAFAKDA